MVESGYINISKLSKASGINRNTLSKILNEEKQPTYPVMCKLVKVLGLYGEEAKAIFFTKELT